MYSLQPCEVKLSNEEKNELSQTVRDAIDEAFLFANHDQTLSTVEPLELHTPVSRNKTYETLTLGIPYDRIFVDAVIDHDHSSHLKSLRIKLFRNDWGHVAHTTLHAYEGDDTVGDKNEINTNEPSFAVACPQDLQSGKRELIPINYTMCRELVNHIVSMANPAIHLNDDRSLLENVEALMALSPETIVDRTAKYRFQNKPNETVEIQAQDKALVFYSGEPRHTYHELQVRRIRSFGRAGSLATLLSINASLNEVETSIAKDFLYKDNVAEEILKNIDDVTNEASSVDTADGFGRQLVDGANLLRMTGISNEDVTRINF